MEIQKFISLIDDVIKNRVSDLHITPENYPYIRNNVGEIVPVQAFGVITNDNIETLTTMLLSRPFIEQTMDISYER